MPPDWYLHTSGFNRTVWEISPLFKRLADHFADNRGDKTKIPRKPTDEEHAAILLAAQKGVSEKEAEAVFQKIHSNLLRENRAQGKQGKIALQRAVDKSMRHWQKYSSDTNFCSIPKLAEIAGLVESRKKTPAIRAPAKRGPRKPTKPVRAVEEDAVLSEAELAKLVLEEHEEPLP